MVAEYAWSEYIVEYKCVTGLYLSLICIPSISYSIMSIFSSSADITDREDDEMIGGD